MIYFEVYLESEKINKILYSSSYLKKNCTKCQIAVGRPVVWGVYNPDKA